MAGFTFTDFTLPVRSGYSTASSHEVALADFNGDGKLDVVLSYFLYPLEDRGVPIRVLTGDGTGKFVDGTSSLFANPPVTVHGRQIILADFNRDGRSDAFFADHGLDAAPFPGARNALFLSQGASGLTNAVAGLPAIADFSHSAAAGDVDGDGDIDLFVGNQGDGEKYPYILLNNGAGGFTVQRSGLPTTLHSGDPGITTSTFFDADRDGDLDLFLGPWDPRSRPAVILENDGKGNFLRTLTTIPIPAHGTSENVIDSHAVDINGDGALDLVINTVVDFFSVGSIRFYINDGTGKFTDETASRLPSRSAEGWNTRVQFADINGDGKVDMLVSNGTSRPVFLNDGTGKFIQTAEGYLPGAGQYDQYHAADLNGDGRMDIFSVRGLYNGNEQFRVYLASPPEPLNAAVTTAISSILRGSNNALATDLSAKVSAGTLTQAAAIAEIVKAADQTTSVATLSYLFFTGKIPGSAGIDYLVSASGPNPNNLNSAYFQSFNLENRYINFAVNLGRDGEGKAAFQADYGSLSLFDATRKAYAEIFGRAPTDAQLTTMLSGGRDAYFASYGGDGLTGQGTKAAMVGWLLAEAEKADLGVMARSNAAWLTDLADGSAPFAIDITAAGTGYYKPEFVFGG
ncbi:FG-GAP-like repeat-containing protein [Caulobacter segnis]|uniref:FG-GAP-like repeat-containing protein n=1 Tax=Caulobacter segnis TaxID=88688 RepID=UPI00240EEFBD|nr:FG-GAP-like repeat-containing protein [Caulobacter segnis]MDG2521330.1 FG-GAP-like repeat-containing protein [Caulobacter segnis]